MAKLHAGMERAKQIAGGTTALAVKLGISKQAVSMWKKIPAERVISIEAATGISREELRPDLYPLRAGRYDAAGKIVIR
jgi:DNA-binding transcriptional regulator YdaS (Cro superfamily)